MDRLFHHTVLSERWLYFVPFMSRHLARYHLDQCKWEIFPLEIEEELTVTGNGLFYQAIILENQVVLLPFTYGSVISIDLKTKATKKLLNLKDIFFDYYCSAEYTCSDWYMNKVFFHQYIFMDSRRILIPSFHANIALQLDLENGSCIKYTIGDSACRLGAATSWNSDIYIASINQPKVFHFDHKMCLKNTVTSFPEGFGKSLPKNRDLLWGRNECIRIRNEWYLFPARANMVCRIDLNTDRVSKIAIFDEFCQPECRDDISYFDGACTDGNRIFLWHKTNRLILYDTVSEEIQDFGDLYDFSKTNGGVFA